MEPAVSPRRYWLVAFLVLELAFYVLEAKHISSAATTDPIEARSLNTIFSKWGIKSTSAWNISGELCSGHAIDGTEIYKAESLNPGIKCNCSANHNSTCHITALKVTTLNVSGPLPDELWNLAYMTDLNLGKNYLTGSIPPAVGRLRRMQYLNFGTNALSGHIPSELGQLTDLISLSVGDNNFTGKLPPQLGNLAKLQQLYINSCGIGGHIPKTFANLRNLQVLFASSNHFVGKIPSYIGNWHNLNVLRLQGNSFHGRIPSSFSKLTKLKLLQVSDVRNVTSSLHFLRRLKSLEKLYLRNNGISDSVPTFFNNFPNLTLLDLSFNNLRGSIPVDLFSHTSLTDLYLGNNSLTGGLPSEKSSNLKKIDVSYNELDGRLPSWISQQNLSLNVVANNLSIDSWSNSVLPFGLHCLQRNFPCNQGSPLYSQFAIKCGGPQIKASNGIVYENDNEILGPANYYMTSSRRWAVSNVGWHQGETYTTAVTSASQLSNTLDPQIFRTSRISTGSLRYYGLGLDNGDYTVTLQFVEPLIVGAKTWTSNGRRIFDVYIQGKLLLRDFNILKEAGGISNEVIVRQFNVSVINNYVEIHLFWAGKGTNGVPSEGTYGPAISAISAVPNFVPTV